MVIMLMLEVLIYVAKLEDNVEGVGSTKDDINANDSVDTPTSKTLGKRPIESAAKDAEKDAEKDADGGASSATNQTQKLARVKIEKID
ncbi:hypothetical protein A2U01_0030697 [Trifolium medium]|uniref:Uncharacterized protein n=1 Tax=Trifolium medium TaxID=97028 RepID=A0A392PDR8_9FABA|nr:hypothetical protein [Trifolium medium]